MIKINDYILLRKEYNSIEMNSVGIVKDTTLKKNTIKVFFIGKNVEIVIDVSYISLLDVSKTGKPYEYKICNVCHILKKDFEEFDVNQTDAQGRKTTRPSCKSCRIQIDGVKLKIEGKKRLEKVKPTYFFICPICEKGSIPGVTANLVRDHDHLTGKEREWLCDSRNTGLGRFKDDISLLKKSIRYLEKYSK